MQQGFKFLFINLNKAITKITTRVRCKDLSERQQGELTSRTLAYELPVRGQEGGNGLQTVGMTGRVFYSP